MDDLCSLISSHLFSPEPIPGEIPEAEQHAGDVSDAVLADGNDSAVIEARALPHWVGLVC